jgi:hypothetical protein
MLAMILLRWHQTISWKLGYGHGTRGRPYSRRWWADEALYALAYTYARRIEILNGEAATFRPSRQNEKFKNAR